MTIPKTKTKRKPKRAILSITQPQYGQKVYCNDPNKMRPSDLVEQAIVDAVPYGAGAVERADAKSEACQRMLARLIEELADKRLLTRAALQRVIFNSRLSKSEGDFRTIITEVRYE